MRQAKAGVVYLVERTKVPVIPVGIVGTTDDFISRAKHFERPLISMKVGKPFYVPEIDEPGMTPKDMRQLKADYIMEQIAALLPVNYQGVYRRQATGSPITVPSHS
jgi:1-acyl-sn-glycerol-3-phosphate acyltransferase